MYEKYILPIIDENTIVLPEHIADALKDDTVVLFGVIDHIEGWKKKDFRNWSEKLDDM